MSEAGREAAPGDHIPLLADRFLVVCRARGILAATAESCTGGLIVAALTDIAGSSSVVDRGFVTYSNEAKVEMLGVKPATLDSYGAVSEQTALEMATGALARSGTDHADLLCCIHLKRSLHDALVKELGLSPDRAVYLDDTGHMSGVDPLLALDRAARAGRVRPGDHVLLLAAGTGYTWAASVLRWG